MSSYQIERRQRGALGWVFVGLFWAFNAFMAYGFFAGLANVAENYPSENASEAYQAGAAIGTVIGSTMIAGLWVAGAAILALCVLFTRGPKIIETVGSATQQANPSLADSGLKRTTQPASDLFPDSYANANDREKPQSSATLQADLIRDLERIQKLREAGVLDDGEFQAQKARILGRSIPGKNDPIPRELSPQASPLPAVNSTGQTDVNGRDQPGAGAGSEIGLASSSGMLSAPSLVVPKSVSRGTPSRSSIDWPKLAWAGLAAALVALTLSVVSLGREATVWGIANPMPGPLRPVIATAVRGVTAPLALLEDVLGIRFGSVSRIEDVWNCTSAECVQEKERYLPEKLLSGFRGSMRTESTEQSECFFDASLPSDQVLPTQLGLEFSAAGRPNSEFVVANLVAGSGPSASNGLTFEVVGVGCEFARANAKSFAWKLLWAKGFESTSADQAGPSLASPYNEKEPEVDVTLPEEREAWVEQCKVWGNTVARGISLKGVCGGDLPAFASPIKALYDQRCAGILSESDFNSLLQEGLNEGRDAVRRFGEKMICTTLVDDPSAFLYGYDLLEDVAADSSPSPATPATTTNPARNAPGVRSNPSFDCAKASTPIELAICRSDTLAELDRAMSQRFEDILVSHPGMRQQLLDEQRAWLQGRDRCSNQSYEIEQCISSLYVSRLEALESYNLVSVPAPAPAVSPKPNPRRFAEMLDNDYPDSAIRKKQEGSVTVSMCMSVDGRASDVQVVKSSGVEALDNATVQGMAKMRFEPAKDGNGKPIAWCPPVYSPYVFTVVWRFPE